MGRYSRYDLILEDLIQEIDISLIAPPQGAVDGLSLSVVTGAMVGLKGLASAAGKTVREPSVLLDGLLCLGQMTTIPQAAESTDDRLLADVEQTLVSWTGRGNFSPAVERYYTEGTRAARERFFIVTAFLGTIAYNLFLFADSLILGDQFWYCVALQLGLVTPVSLGFIIAVIRGKADPSSATFTVLSMMLGGVLLVLQNLSGEAAHLYIGVAVLIIIGANLVLALSIVWAVAFTVFANAAVLSAILLHPSMTTNAGLFVFAILAVGSTYAVIGNYRIDAGVRIAFLHALMERLRADQLATSNRRLEKLVDVDGLTGVGNRRSFDAELERSRNLDGDHESTPVALLLIDIDRFKLVNDTHGHLTGDACLRHVAQILAEGTDGEVMHLARYGGEEFAVLIAQATAEEAYALAETLRLAVEARPVVTDAQMVRLTVSIGCAVVTIDEHGSDVDLIAAADAALYLAKASGRNRSMMAGLSSLEARRNQERRLAS